MLLIQGEEGKTLRETMCDLCNWEVGHKMLKSFSAFEQKLEGRRSCPGHIK